MAAADLAVVATGVSGLALAMHAGAAVAMSWVPARGYRFSGGENPARKARAWAGAANALVYLAVSVLAVSGISLHGVTAGSLIVFSVMQLAWLASTGWDLARHLGAAGGGG